MREMHDDHPQPNIDLQYVLAKGVALTFPTGVKLAAAATLQQAGEKC